MVSNGLFGRGGQEDDSLQGDGGAYRREADKGVAHFEWLPLGDAAAFLVEKLLLQPEVAAERFLVVADLRRQQDRRAVDGSLRMCPSRRWSVKVRGEGALFVGFCSSFGETARRGGLILENRKGERGGTEFAPDGR